MKFTLLLGAWGPTQFGLYLLLRPTLSCLLIRLQLPGFFGSLNKPSLVWPQTSEPLFLLFHLPRTFCSQNFTWLASCLSLHIPSSKSPNLSVIPHLLLFVFPIPPSSIFIHSPCHYLKLFKICVPCIEWKLQEGKIFVYLVHLWVPNM